MTKHTPEPWHLVGVTSWAVRGPVRPGTVYIISDEAEPRKGKMALACAFTEDHARLIAAAPALLHAAERAADVIANPHVTRSYGEEVLADLRAAIAAAQPEGGES